MKPDEVITEALRSRTFPGIDVSVIKNGKIVFTSTKGCSCIIPEKKRLEPHSYFDLASLTKSLATAPVTLEVFAGENIPLSRKAGYFLPELTGDSENITIVQLLSHTSGLPPSPEIYRISKTPEEIDRKTAVSRILEVKPVITPGTGIIYSCTGYIFLSLILERITGRSLPDLFREIISVPAGIEELTFNPLDSGTNKDRIVPTELCRWRNRLIRGEVHDENSYCLGGQAGNAGLFGTRKGVEDFMTILTSEGCLGKKRILSETTVKMMTSPLAEDIITKRTAGFMMQSAESFAGNMWTHRAFGHTGFTGTSVWTDPGYNIIITILTNRVHLGREKTSEKIKTFRKEFHSSVFSEFCRNGG